MMQNPNHHRLAAAAPLLVTLLGAMALAQWQVNSQVGQVNRRVGGELYGNNTNMGSVRYAQSRSASTAMPSEVRNATWRSGALPSEIAMGRAAIGPLAPSGAISYVPGQSPVQAAMKMPAPPLYNANHQFGQTTTVKSDALIPPQPGYAPSSIRYSAPAGAAPAATAIAAAPQNVSTGQVPAHTVPAPGALKLQPTFFDSINSGSIRYATPPTP